MKWLMALYRHVFVPTSLKLLKFAVPLLSPKLQMMLDEREHSQYLPLGTTQGKAPFWIHCSSGEFEYAKPVIRALKRDFPEHSVIVTYMSPSVKMSIQNFKEVDLSLPVPWDRPDDINQFLESFKPQLLLIARTDAWPELMTQVRARQIPSLLFSATLADKSSRLRLPGRLFSRLALDQIDEIHCVSLEDEKNFKKVCASPHLAIKGDTRYEEVLHRVKHPRSLKVELRPEAHTDPIIVLGSTWPEDEEPWLEALSALKKMYPQARVMVAPHEPDVQSIERLARKLGNVGFAARIYSNAKVWNPGESLLIDQVGLLADLYGWGNLAFVGGSFKKHVHSVMEPLAHGLCVLVGPRHKNNREALLFSEKAISGHQGHVVTVVRSSAEIVAAVENLKPCWSSGPHYSAIREALQEQAGATQEVLNWVSAQLDRSDNSSLRPHQGESRP